MSNQENRSYSFGRFRLDCRGDKRTLFEDGSPKDPPLSSSQAVLLEKMLEQANHFVSTEDLREGTNLNDKNAIAVAVHHLRQILPGVVIETQKNKGYRYVRDGDSSPLENAPMAVEPKVSGADELPPSPKVKAQAVVEPPPSTESAFGMRAESVIVTTNQTAYSLTGNEFLIITIAVGVAIFLLPLGLWWVAGKWDPSFNKILSFFQAIAVAVAILYDYVQKRHIQKSLAEESKEEIAVGQFRFWWTCLLLSWFVLYLTWFLRDFAIAPIVATFLNNGNSLTLTLCYIVLDRPTVISNTGQSVKPIAVSGTEQSVKPVPIKLGVGLVLGFSLLQGLLITALSFFGHDDSTKYVLFSADLISGFVGAVAMALCISRLHSRLMGPSTWLPIIPVVLYFYVVIQPFYILVNETFLQFESVKPFKPQLDLLKTIIMQLAFLLKALMFIYVMELVRSRRLTFYMINARSIYDDVENRWKEFKSH